MQFVPELKGEETKLSLSVSANTIEQNHVSLCMLGTPSPADKSHRATVKLPRLDSLYLTGLDPRQTSLDRFELH